MIDAQQALSDLFTAYEAVGKAVEEKDASLNTLSLRVDSLAEANFQLQAQNDALRQENAALKLELSKRPMPPEPVDPWAKVDKTGATDVTAQVQALLDSGIRTVPAGKYLIDASKGVYIRDNVAVKADANAVLVCKPNALPRYYILRLTGAKASWTGGQVLGDRDAHTYTAGSTHEWGFGVDMSGDGASLSDCLVSGCTGDGIRVVGDYVVLRNVISRLNRRQGMSVFACKGFRAYKCGFTNTRGTAPQAGVDFEPDNGAIVDAVMEDCWSTDNATTGFLAWVREEVAGNVEVTLKNCSTDGNANGIQGKGLNGKALIRVEGGSHVNKSACVRAESGSVITLVGGTYDITDKSQATAQNYAIQKYGTGQVVQSGVVYK